VSVVLCIILLMVVIVWLFVMSSVKEVVSINSMNLWQLVVRFVMGNFSLVLSSDEGCVLCFWVGLVMSGMLDLNLWGRVMIV